MDGKKLICNLFQYNSLFNFLDVIYSYPNPLFSFVSLLCSVFVTQFPSDQSLFVGKAGIIQCSANGYPKPTFKWYKNRRVINLSDPRFTRLSNGSLLIDPVHELDADEYICRIEQLGAGTDQETNLREQQKVITVTVNGTFRLEKRS